MLNFSYRLTHSDNQHFKEQRAAGPQHTHASAPFISCHTNVPQAQSTEHLVLPTEKRQIRCNEWEGSFSPVPVLIT